MASLDYAEAGAEPPVEAEVRRQYRDDLSLLYEQDGRAIERFVRGKLHSRRKDDAPDVVHEAFRVMLNGEWAFISKVFKATGRTGEPLGTYLLIPQSQRLEQLRRSAYKCARYKAKSIYSTE